MRHVQSIHRHIHQRVEQVRLSLGLRGRKTILDDVRPGGRTCQNGSLPSGAEVLPRPSGVLKSLLQLTHVISGAAGQCRIDVGQLAGRHRDVTTVVHPARR